MIQGRALLVSALALVCGSLLVTAPVQAAFPGTNGKIAFTMPFDSHHGRSKIYTVNPDGSGQTSLMGSLEGYPTWSPDGTKIAFLSDQLYTMNPDGSGRTAVPGTLADFYPSWSPDGSSFALSNGEGAAAEINTIYVNGRGRLNISRSAGGDIEPAWSPNPRKIAFTTDRDANYEIYTMNDDGSGQTNISNNAATDRQPSWSPDGTKIAFTTDRDGNSEIYTMNADGSGQTSITNNVAIDNQPAWSPDGTKIAFTRQDFGIYTMNADGSGQTLISTDVMFTVSNARDPDWGPLPRGPAPLQPLADKTAPTVKLRYARKQRVSKLSVVVQLNEAGTVTARGSVAAAGGASRVYKFKQRSRRVRANAKTRLRFRLRARSLRAVRRVLKRKRLKAKIIITAKDQVGNRRTSTVRIKLRR
jgi:dipeptidyl aminopeptidase/acylaminoacyl peptidase